MEVVNFLVRGRKGISLSCFKVVPEGEIKGIVHILHGMGDHKERFLHFAKFLAKNSFAVYVHDHRKHGDSLKEDDNVGIFTKEDSWDSMIDDTNFVNRRIKKELPDLPIITMGHSMGSIITRKFLATYPASSTMAIIMGTTPPMPLGKVLVPYVLSIIMTLFNRKNKRSEYFGKIFNDSSIKFFEPRRTNFDWLSSDEKVVDKYIEDPLCGYNYSTRFYREFFKGVLNANKSDVIFETKEIPLLFISGKKDPVGEFGEGVKGMRELYSGHGFLDLTLELVDDARHEILNDTNKEYTYKFILEWIEKSLEKIATELE